MQHLYREIKKKKAASPGVSDINKASAEMELKGRIQVIDFQMQQIECNIYYILPCNTKYHTTSPMALPFMSLMYGSVCWSHQHICTVCKPTNCLYTEILLSIYHKKQNYRLLK